jgi:hypothetical protein
MGHTNLLFEDVERGHRNSAQAFYHDIGAGEKAQALWSATACRRFVTAGLLGR